MVARVVPNIATDNVAVGQEFYTDVLGLEVAMDMGWIVTFASPDNPSVQLTVVESDPAMPHPDYSVEVTDVDACYRRAEGQECVIVHPLTVEPWGVRRFFVRDPHGKVANVMQHVDAPGSEN